MLKKIYDRLQGLFEVKDNEIDYTENIFEMDKEYEIEAGNIFSTMQNSLAI